MMNQIYCARIRRHGAEVLYVNYLDSDSEEDKVSPLIFYDEVILSAIVCQNGRVNELRTDRQHQWSVRVTNEYKKDE